MKQDNIDRIGWVQLGKGYQVNPPNQKKLVPRNRLTVFLNVNILDNKDVQDFCNNYRLIPNDLENGWLEGFVKLQTQIKGIIDRTISKTLTQEDLDFVNKQIEGVHTKVVFLNEAEMQDTNININGVDYEFFEIKRQNKEKNTTEIRVFPSIQCTLYWDVKNYIIDNRQYRMCGWCSAYFLVRRKDQIYCTYDHKELARERRRNRTK